MLVANGISIAGKLVRPVQLRQAAIAPVTSPALSGGKLVNPVQPCHVLSKDVQRAVFSAGKDVRLAQLTQAPRKVVALDVSIKGNEVSE